MSDMTKYQQQAEELSQKLWSIACDLRGNMDGAKFKNYILGTIFYSFLSERTEQYMTDLLRNETEKKSYKEAFNDDEFRPVIEEMSLDHLGYIIKPEYLFSELVRKISKPENDGDRFTIEDYSKAIKALEDSTEGQESHSDFDGLFSDMRLEDPDLGNSVDDRTDLISKVILRISEISFTNEDSEFDVLGTAYMILIGQFASDAGKKSGEFFTPTGPAKLVATLASLGLTEAESVADCTCGSASMLLEVQKHLANHRVGHYYGQENNASTFNLARMNMLMHGIPYQDFDIYKGDTINNDMYGNTKMTIQVCNPPYSLKYDANPKLLKEPRYSGAGKLAPKSHADYAFVEHMIYHMDEQNGRVAVLLPHGVLFRGGAEATIRKYIVKDLNRLDAVIGLAPNLFHGTSIPVCLLILKSNRGVNKDNILFIDASKEFTHGKKQNLMEDSHIQKIVDAYQKRVDIDQFAHVASYKEIEANDFNLNIPRYVDTREVEPDVDLKKVAAEIKDTNKSIESNNAELQAMLSQLVASSTDIADALNDLVDIFKKESHE